MTQVTDAGVHEINSSSLLPWAKLVRTLIIAEVLVCFTLYAIFSWHWRMMHDSQVTHYVTFLMNHGWAPYRQIHDMNMPGSYLFENWAIEIFGSSDRGWRLYDLALSAIATGSMIAIARDYEWVAGLLAGCTFALSHGAELGPLNTGQRDLVMTVALLVAYAFCFESVRRKNPWLMGGLGLASGMAASIKPTLILLGPIILALALAQLHRKKIKLWQYVVSGLAGFAVSIAIVLHFLLVHNSLNAFMYDLREIIPHYVSLEPMSWPEMIRNTLPRRLEAVALGALLLAVFTKRWRNWEMVAIITGMFFGLASFYMQHKGFAYHRYTTIAFAMLWSSILLFTALRECRWLSRSFAVLIVAFLMVDDWPKDLRLIRGDQPDYSIVDSMQKDMEALGLERLQHRVQCLDITDGCLTALYHLQILQSNGSTGDLLLFIPGNSKVVEQARSMFTSEIQAQTPTVFIMTNKTFSHERSFEKIAAWPAFAAFLNSQYELAIERHFGRPLLKQDGTEELGPSYRIYILRGSPLSKRFASHSFSLQ